MSSAQFKKFSLVKPAEIEWRSGLPYSLEFNDVYFSIHGAVEESTHVFIEGNQLTNDWDTNPEKDFTIAELGFGSGLNFLNTMFHWLEHRSKLKKNYQHINYLAIEKRPFTKNDLIKVSKIWPQFSYISERLIRDYPSQTYGRHQLVYPDWNLTLTLMWMPLEDALNDLIQESTSQKSKAKIDHWFLDGFAPLKNTSMWEEKNALKIAKLSNVGTRLATYSVAGAVKRPLIEAGFKIIKCKGFAKKREMLTAVLLGEIQKEEVHKFVNIKYEKPWFNISNNKKNKTSKPSIAIIGSGIAGCTTAYTLSNKGFNCDIYESNSQIAMGASGAAAGIFHPQLSSDMNLSSQFNWLAYLSLLRFLSSLTTQERDSLIINQGVLRFLENKQSKQQLIDLSSKLNLSHWIKDDFSISGKYNLINERQIYFPHSAALDIPTLCQLYLDKIEKHSFNLYTDSTISDIVRENNLWQVHFNNDKKHYQHVVFCGGANSQLLNRFNIMKTHTTRGQTCQINSSVLGKAIIQTLSEQIYLVPQKNTSKQHLNQQTNQFQIGASFERLEHSAKLDSFELKGESQKDILTKCYKLLKELSISSFRKSEIEQTPLNGTVGYRLHSNDRLPLVGPAIDKDSLETTFSNFGQKRILRDSLSTYNQSGLWVNTAYGSHGLLYSLLSSQHLSSLMSNSISPLESKVSNILHPARSLIKRLNQPSDDLNQH
ncbi:MAG: tRNA 5-methylaminomethyl-2-thiouridine biosynthesis bifunctional protein [Polaribacter sp.]|jgi:tRNA 5-methylaminomethyl-2-thiouridine biosynthesis bifunctional protein